MLSRRRLVSAFAALGLILAPVAALADDGRWVGGWASSQMVAENEHALPDGAMDDVTLRQVVRLTASGDRIRVRVSNAFGDAPLQITRATVSRPRTRDGAMVDPATATPLTFAGRSGVMVPAGAEFVSDPVDFEAEALSHLAVTFHVADAPPRLTAHPGARATGRMAPGDQTGAAVLTDETTFTRWYLLSGVDVLGPADAGSIVVLGDSITDGYGVHPDTDTRWPDFLAERLQADPRTAHLGVLNHGIGGNRMLRDGLGPNALARFERDVLSQTGVTHLIILEGVNDLGVLTREAPATPEAHEALVADMIGAYAQMTARARERGITVIGATITPYGGSDYYRPDAANEADRQAINAWFRTPGNVDAVIDFDAVMRDPHRPTHLRPEYDSDGLHPSIEGYRAMGEAVDLRLFLAHED
ncbi:SGNH/GDSL hydrolase family protein [Brevundimonas sp.]|uniref:SGNH/GDSL hydrolase family protein n=1 Tax=Brevundimonas sp. TaxID=1871086 RepID=UPI001D60120F|nr:SGNH/GDSL hydrolase family protein [Brevundimonas sp.]MBA4001279.1 GDSL family lipase [Brevundimonas sp.]